MENKIQESSFTYNPYRVRIKRCCASCAHAAQPKDMNASRCSDKWGKKRLCMMQGGAAHDNSYYCGDEEMKWAMKIERKGIIPRGDGGVRTRDILMENHNRLLNLQQKK